MTRQGSTHADGGDSEGVLAGKQLPKAMIAPVRGFDPSRMDETTLQLARLKALHPNLTVQFRTEDLAGMTAIERGLLLQDCYDVLGVAIPDGIEPR